MHHVYCLHMVMTVCSASRNATACLVYLIFLYSLPHMYAYFPSLLPLVPRVTSSCLVSVPLPASCLMAHSHRRSFCSRSRRRRHLCCSSDLEQLTRTTSGSDKKGRCRRVRLSVDAIVCAVFVRPSKKQRWPPLSLLRLQQRQRWPLPAPKMRHHARSSPPI